jgi:glycosyltransferase involved in cell wall biosynthesis
LLSLSIILPAFNEQARLPSTLDRVLEYTASRCFSFLEILVVDDGSADRTPDIVRSYSETSPHVRLLSNPGNRGKGYAVRHGMLKARGEWRLFTDADLSAPIEDMEKLFDAAMKQDAVIGFGSRALDRRLVSVRQDWGREMSGRFFNVIVRLVTGLPYQDTQCGFKLYRADAAEAVFSRQKLDGFGFDVEDLFIARRLGLKAVEVPVRWANVEGTRVSLTSGLRAFLDLLLIRRYALRGDYDDAG